MKQLIAATVIALAAFGGTLLLNGCSQDVANGSEPAKGFALSDSMMARIAIDTVRNEPLCDVLTLTGKVQLDQSKRADVYPTFGGQVESTFAELGDYKQKGDLLAVIHSGEATDYDLQLADAQRDVDVAGKNLSVQKDMASNNLTTDKEVLAAQKEYDKSVDKLKTLKSTTNLYNINGRGEYALKAPMSGFIVSKNISKDMMLRSDKSDPVFTISEINNIWVIANAYETNISRISVGMDAEITTLSYPDKKFYGKVDRIFNAIDPQTRAMQVRICLPNPGFELKPEMFANVRLFRREDARMAAAPASSIIFDNGRNYVMVYHDRNSIETRPIRVLKTADDTAYIADGLKPGERIITRDQLFVYDELND